MADGPSSVKLSTSITHQAPRTLQTFHFSSFECRTNNKQNPTMAA